MRSAVAGQLVGVAKELLGESGGRLPAAGLGGFAESFALFPISNPPVRAGVEAIDEQLVGLASDRGFFRGGCSVPNLNRGRWGL